MKLQTRLLLFILTIVILAFAAVVLLNALKSKDAAIRSAEEIAQSNARQHAKEVEAKLDRAMQAAATLADTLAGMKQSNTVSRTAGDEILKQILERNREYLTVWSLWEPNAFDGQDALHANPQKADKTGAYMPVWARDGSKIIYDDTYVYDKEVQANYYTLPKASKKNVVIEPYMGKVDEKDVLMTSFVAPVIVNDQFTGVVGIDMALDVLQEDSKNIRLYQTGFGQIFSHNGLFISAHDGAFLGKSLAETTLPYKDLILPGIAGGKEMHTIKDGNYYFQTPIQIGNSEAPWSLMISIPLAEIDAEPNRTLVLTVVSGAAGLLLITLTIVFITRRIVRSISVVAEHAQIIADGDFTRDLPQAFLKRKDELGLLAHSFAHISIRMNETLQKLIASSQLVASTAEQLSASAEQSSHASNEIGQALTVISSGTEEQAQNAHESAAAMQGMASGINQVALTAQTVLQASEEMAKQANAGFHTVQDAGTRMHAIMGTIDRSRQQVSAVVNVLRNDSDEIGQILSLIAGVAAQTNLLALNAAIEAARAGEAGRGFAIVADEIRKLADQTKGSAEKIQAIMTNIQANAEQTAAIMDSGKADVASGMSLVAEIGDVFSTIRDSVEDVSGKISQLTSITEQMSANSEEVAASIDEIAKISSGSAEQVSHVAASSEEQLATMDSVSRLAIALSDMAIELKAMIHSFKVK